jgi:hypothetical protein
MGTQSLLGYAHQHLDLIDFLTASGIKCSGLVVALRLAGFDACSPKGLENAIYRARRKPRQAPPAVGSLHEFPMQISKTPSPAAVPVPAPTPRQIRKTATFDYQGTLNLDPTKLV